MCTLGAFILTQLPDESWGVPEIEACLESFTRLKVTYAVYENALERSIDSIGPCYSLTSLPYPGCCPFRQANVDGVRCYGRC